jgi:hypothetical protein
VSQNQDYEVFFFDESRFGTHSRIGHGWFKTGSRPEVKKRLIQGSSATKSFKVKH